MRFATALAAVLILSGGARAADAPAPIRFGRDILPILSANCFECHGPDDKARQAELRLDTRAGALKVLEPGHSGASELMRRLQAGDDELMPPPRTNRVLTAAQKATLRRWIDEGAVWSKHWAYETPVRPALPRVRNTAWVRNGIDRFVLARLEQEGIPPADEAARTTLIRRVSLDLTGLPPTLSEIDAFLADQDANAYAKVVDRLLSSPRYGERMATEWLDVARFADTNGYQNDFARSMWPWRDWVIDAFNRNMPFDQFTIEQLAGDLLPSPTRAQRVATGFNRNNRTVTEAGSIDEEWRVENAVDRIETTATVFLGLTMGCGRCHDHKFDPISQREFYQFFAFFNSINEKGMYSEVPGNVPPLIRLTNSADEERLQQFDAALAAAEPEAKDTIAKLRKERAEFEKRLPTVMVMEDLKTPRPTYVLTRGRYDVPDKNQQVEPGVPSCLPPLSAAGPRNRLGLARWLVAPDNPLTARVTVNRVWQRLFGLGLVKTGDNFGLQGERPSHPELLDWLARELADGGWDLKALHRLIVTSATYRQSSRATPVLLQRDPDNRLLAHGPRFRLPAELVRDNALAITGLLVEKEGGPSVKPYQPAGLWEEMAGGSGEGPYVQEKGAGLYRRSLYIYRKRTVPPPTMMTFDAPSREVCQVRQARTDTPLQALELLNDVTYVEAARHLAQLMILEGGRTPQERLTYAFRRATARAPTPTEMQILLRGLERYFQNFGANRGAALRYIRHGDSQPNELFHPIELAAYTATASVILNMDETITKE